MRPLAAVSLMVVSAVITACGAPAPDNVNTDEIDTGNAVTETLNTAITPGGGADVMPTTGAPGSAGSRSLDDAPQNTSALREAREGERGEGP